MAAEFDMPRKPVKVCARWFDDLGHG